MLLYFILLRSSGKFIFYLGISSIH
jgi:hypothetical protein